MLVGAVDSRLALFDGTRATEIVDLTLKADLSGPPDPPARADVHVPTKVVHVTSVKEYARLQRGDYTEAKPSHVNVHA